MSEDRDDDKLVTVRPKNGSGLSRQVAAVVELKVNQSLKRKIERSMEQMWQALIKAGVSVEDFGEACGSLRVERDGGRLDEEQISRTRRELEKLLPEDGQS